MAGGRRRGETVIESEVCMRLRDQSLASLSGLRIWHCRELWYRCRCGSDLVLLWLWRRLAALALTQPIAWELPYAAIAALKNKKKNE